MSRPACMDEVEWAEWSRANDLLPRVNRVGSPCVDCTVRFAIEMKLVGRCDSWPVADDGGRPWKRSPDERQQMARRRWRESKRRRRAAGAAA